MALKNLGTQGLGSRRLAGWNTKKGSCPIGTLISHLCPTSHIPTEPQALVHCDPSDKPSPSLPEGLLQAMTLACSLLLQTGKARSWQREPRASMLVLLLGPNNNLIRIHGHLHCIDHRSEKSLREPDHPEGSGKAQPSHCCLPGTSE